MNESQFKTQAGGFMEFDMNAPRSRPPSVVFAAIKFSATQRLINQNRFLAGDSLFAKKSVRKGAYITQQQFEDIYYNRAPKDPKRKSVGP